MKNIMTKNIIRKIAIIILIVMCVNFIFPPRVQASSIIKYVGGVILSDIIDLLMFVGDAVLDILQKNFISLQDVVVEAKSRDEATFHWSNILKIVAGIILCVVAVAITIASFGTLSWAGIGAIMTSITIIGGVLISNTKKAGVGVFLCISGAKSIIEEAQGYYDLPMIRYTPYEIFSGQIPLLDVNFINPMDSIEETITDEDGNEETIKYQSSAGILQESISTWYNALRYFAMVVLLLILVYVGIRIIISSVAEEKAKYKKLFIDWLTALCILFILHYIMIFILDISQSLTNIFLANNSEPNIIVKLPENTKVKVGDNWTLLQSQSWSCSFTGYMRLQAGLYVDEKITLDALAYCIIYLALVVYTCMFTFIYIKRVLYMAFLTMIAPLIAVTYPLDKMKDGEAQAYGLWFREFTFNALIQPIHLIIYILTVSNIMNMIKDHPIFALIAMGFLIPAEKFIRKMFGFEKAGTVGTLGKAAGGAVIMSGIKQLKSIKPQHSAHNEDGENQKNNVRTADNNKYKLNISDVSTSEKTSKNVNNEGQETNIQQENGETEINISQTVTDENNSNSNSNGAANNVNVTTPDSQTNGILMPVQANNPTKTTANPVQKNGRSFISKINSGMMNVGSHYRKQALKSHPLRFLGKLTGKAIGATTLGMVGLAAGITTGNMKDVITFTAGAASVGGTIGGNISENIMDEGKEEREAFNRGYWGEQEYNNRKLDREFVENDEIMKYVNNEDLHPEMRGNIIKETRRLRRLQEEVQIYRQAGITDDKQIMNAMEMGLTPTEGVYTIQLASRISKSNWNKRKTRENYLDKFRTALHDKGVNDDQIDKIFKNIPRILFKG